MSALQAGEVDVIRYSLPNRGRAVVVTTGPSTEHERPVLGDTYHTPRHRVEVYVSPTGRSVRVWMDGKELTAS